MASETSPEKGLNPSQADLKIERIPDDTSTASTLDVEKGPSSTNSKLVTWNGPDDPENPRNWSQTKKWIVTFLMSTFSFVTLTSSTIISPALEDIRHSLHITSDLDVQLTMATFVLGYAFGPLLFGPLSEIYGCTRVMQFSNIWFFAWSVGTGFVTTNTQMIIARLMAGIGGSASLAVGGGVLSAVWAPEQRGLSLSIYSLFPLLGPAIGPIMGGAIAQNASWRWCFWVTAILDGVVIFIAFFFFAETHNPTILHRRAARQRKLTGDDSYQTETEMNYKGLKETLRISVSRPLKLLATHPVIQLISVYSAYTFGLIYIVHTTFPTLWETKYHESSTTAGLNAIAIAIGFTFSALVGGPTIDRIWAYFQKKRLAALGPSSPDAPPPVLELIPEHRVPLMLPGAVLTASGLFIYGWCAEAHAVWIGPNIGITIFSAGAIISNQCQTAYIVDSYPHNTASAMAAATVLKSIAGFAFPLFAPQMYSALGYGWGDTLIAILVIFLSVPVPVILWRYGARMRKWPKPVA